MNFNDNATPGENDPVTAIDDDGKYVSWPDFIFTKTNQVAKVDVLSAELFTCDGEELIQAWLRIGI